MGKEAVHPPARRADFRAALARFVGKRRRSSEPRPGAPQKNQRLHKFAPRNLITRPDPVSLAIFAIDCIGPASLRACASGVEVSVAAPDEATAAVFRAALANTATRHGTDRLIRIVVE